MSKEDEAIETLTGLGLTVLQARVYLALAKGGKATVKDIAKKSSVARQDLYRITPSLLSIGLIEKHIDTPTKFKAIPIEEAISKLIERQKKQTAKLEEDSKLILPYYTADTGADTKDEESQFAIVPDMQSILLKIRRQAASAEKTVRVVTKWSFFLTYSSETIDEYIKTLDRGVKVYVVTQAPKKTEVYPKRLNKLLKHPNFQTRFVASQPTSIVGIYDKKEVNVALATDKGPSGTGLLISNNPNLIELAQNYFDIMWNSASVCCFN